ncbi:hepatic lectin-like [Clinocottus analis]|uniref:hepatic lectin-like n=1 Tax=Clinocottus analis TaxID=304258 RepID=UPI0035C1839C
MSVTLSSKSGEVGVDSVNLMASDNRPKSGWRSHIAVWWIGAAAVCLGFLLLILILVVTAQNSKALGHQDSKGANLIYSLSADKDTLRDERDQLKLKSINLTKETELLQTQYNAVAVSRDTLQEEVNRLIFSRKDEPCQLRWISFKSKCYYFSPSAMTNTWESSRKDCKARGADLVVINTKEELDFVVQFYATTWIGLSDRDQESNWKWVDGSSERLTSQFWETGEPNDDHSNEDCAEGVRLKRKFNDVRCDKRLPWACEE